MVKIQLILTTGNEKLFSILRRFSIEMKILIQVGGEDRLDARFIKFG